LDTLRQFDKHINVHVVVHGNVTMKTTFTRIEKWVFLDCNISELKIDARIIECTNSAAIDMSQWSIEKVENLSLNCPLWHTLDFSKIKYLRRL
jgi:hypothetical protein